MAPRYQHNLRLPDKAINWLDTASVKVEIENSDRPVLGKDVIHVISRETRIPLEMVFRDTTERFKEIEEALAQRVVGQKEAIAALAFGTESIPKVDKICGPGNIFVTLATPSLKGALASRPRPRRVATWHNTCSEGMMCINPSGH
jgi:hypothetical protein